MATLHAVFIPSPFQGHIKYLLKLAKLYHNRGFHITFVNTEYNHKRFLESNSSDRLPDDFQFKTIPDGLPPPSDGGSQDLLALTNSLYKNNLFAPFVDLVNEVNENSSVPSVTCIVADGFMPFTITAARQLRIPVFVFFTISASSFMAFKQFRAFRDKGITPIKDTSYLTNGYLDEIVDWVPGMKNMRLRDFSSHVQSTDLNDLMYNYVMEATERASEATGVIIHTFDALEKDVLGAISSFIPRLYTIGPVQMFLNDIKDDPLKSVGYSLWKEDEECLRWLDSKEKNLVLYVNFGSVVMMTQEKLVELAMGLANSEHPFLWIIRPDLVSGESSVLPQEFTIATRDRSMISSWCPQEEILSHPSIGGFLTHCGWGSMMESLIAGVPMLCLPFAGDQQTNCRYACVEWGVGMEIDQKLERDVVGKLVKELMDGENGARLRSKATEWKMLAREATSPDGSSFRNLDKLVHMEF